MLKPCTNTTKHVNQPKVVFALHGINTYANWHRMFGEVVGASGWICRSDRWYFGKFSVIRFLLPWQRNSKVGWFRKEYDEECNDRETGVDLNNDHLPSIIAHSFGTYILGNALLKYDNIRFNKVILCGSILPTDFPWDKILERGQVQYVRNDYGSADIWSKIVQYAVRGSGPSGQVGFSVEHERLSQFGYSFEHSEYFDKGHIRSNWLPFLSSAERFWPTQSEPIAVPKWPMPWLGRIVFGLLILLVGVAVSFRHDILRTIAEVWQQNDAPSTDDEPTSAIALANVLAEPDFPTRSEVLKNIAKPQQETVLTVQNNITRPLKLLLFNCAAHYGDSDRQLNLRRLPFVELPLPPATGASPGLQPFSRFPPKFSHYGLYIIDSKNGSMSKVGFVNFSSKSDWFLQIRESGKSIESEWTDAP